MVLAPPTPPALRALLALMLRALGLAAALLAVFALAVALQRLAAERPAAPALIPLGAVMLAGGVRGLLTLPGASPRVLGLLALDVALLAAALAALLAGGLAEG
jgi:hypothetical protein